MKKKIMLFIALVVVAMNISSCTVRDEHGHPHHHHHHHDDEVIIK